MRPFPLAAPQHEPLRGRMVESLTVRKNRRYPLGRVCSEPGCITILSVYNPADTCWSHREMVPVRRGTAA